MLPPSKLKKPSPPKRQVPHRAWKIYIGRTWDHRLKWLCVLALYKFSCHGNIDVLDDWAMVIISKEVYADGHPGQHTTARTTLLD